MEIKSLQAYSITISAKTSQPEDPNRPDNLWHPVEGDHGAHGTFAEEAHEKSWELRASVGRRWVETGLAAAALACFYGHESLVLPPLFVEQCDQETFSDPSVSGNQFLNGFTDSRVSDRFYNLFRTARSWSLGSLVLYGVTAHGGPCQAFAV